MPIADASMYSQSDQEDDTSSPVDLAAALRRASVLPKAGIADEAVPDPNLAAAYGKARVPVALFLGVNSTVSPTGPADRILRPCQAPPGPVMSPEYETALMQDNKDLQPLYRTKREYQ